MDIERIEKIVAALIAKYKKNTKDGAVSVSVKGNKHKIVIEGELDFLDLEKIEGGK